MKNGEVYFHLDLLNLTNFEGQLPQFVETIGVPTCGLDMSPPERHKEKISRKSPILAVANVHLSLIWHKSFEILQNSIKIGFRYGWHTNQVLKL